MKLKYVSIYKPKGRAGRNRPYLLALSIGRRQRRVIAGSTDFGVSMQMAAKLSPIVERVRLGLALPHELDEALNAGVSIESHLADFEQALNNRGVTKKHAEQTRQYAEAALSGVLRISDITSSKIQANVARLSKVGDATRNRHLTAVKSFLAWGSTEHRWSAEIAASLRLTRYKGGTKNRRRVLEPHELRALLKATESGPVRRGMTGKERSLLYRTATLTGLRLSELAELTPGDLRGESIRVRSETAKNSKDDEVLVPAGVVTELKELSRGRARVFKMPPHLRTLYALKGDLRAAGIPYKTDAGKFDFHAFRHQCGSMLSSRGMRPKAVQRQMRHADIRLTFDTYGHVFEHDREQVNDVISTIDAYISGAGGDVGKRRAQRADVVNGLSRSLPFAESEASMPENAAETQYPLGESNPCPLAEKRESLHVLSLLDKDLRAAFNRKIAPREARRQIRLAGLRRLRRAPSPSRTSAERGRG